MLRLVATKVSQRTLTELYVYIYIYICIGTRSIRLCICLVVYSRLQKRAGQESFQLPGHFCAAIGFAMLAVVMYPAEHRRDHIGNSNKYPSPCRA